MCEIISAVDCAQQNVVLELRTLRNPTSNLEPELDRNGRDLMGFLEEKGLGVVEAIGLIEEG